MRTFNSFPPYKARIAVISSLLYIYGSKGVEGTKRKKYIIGAKYWEKKW